MLVGILLARSLGSAGYGEYVFLLSVVSFCGIPIQSGLHTLVVRETARYTQTEQWSYLKGLFRAAYIYVVSFSLLIAGAGIVCIACEWVSVDSEKRTFYIALLLLPFIQVNILRSAIMRGFKKVSQSELPEQIIKPLVLTLLLSGSIYLDQALTTLDAVSYALIATICAFITARILIRKCWPSQLKHAAPQRDMVSWKKGFSALAVFSWVHIANAQINVLMLGSLLNSNAVGLFQVGFQAASVVAIALTVLNSVTSPHIVQLRNENRMAALQTLLTRSAQLATGSALVLVLAYWLWGELILYWVFGTEYEAAWGSMMILSIGHLVSAFAGSVGITLQMLGHEKSPTHYMILAFLANLSLSYLLIPIYGIEGSAFAFATSIILWNLLLVNKLRRATTLNSTIFRFRR